MAEAAYKILSASPNQSWLQRREAILRNRQFDVQSAPNAGDALRLLAGKHFDALVLCDSFVEKDENRILSEARSREVPVLVVFSDGEDPRRRPNTRVHMKEGDTALLATLDDLLGMAALRKEFLNTAAWLGNQNHG